MTLSSPQIVSVKERTPHWVGFRNNPATSSIEIRPWWQYFLVALILTCTYTGFGWLDHCVWVRQHGINPQVICIAALVAILSNYLVFARRRLTQVAEFVLLNSDSVPRLSRRTAKIWVALGFGFLCSMLYLLERFQPMYFTRDDNTVQFLPMMVYAGRSLLHGTFPEWNPYQFMGAPSGSLGIYAFTYPFTYISYLVARFVLHNELLTIDAFVIFHLTAGFFAMYWASRSYQLRPSIAALAGVCSSLSGFALIGTRNWYYMCPVFLYVPLALGGFEKLRTSRNPWKWAVFLGCVVGIFFHAGNAQMWSYTVLFLAVAVGCSFLARAFTLREAFWFLPAALIGLGLAFPLLHVQMQATKAVVRPMSADTGSLVPESATALLVPGSWLGETAASDWGPGTDLRQGAEMLYSGTLFTLATVIPTAFLFIYRLRARVLNDNLWVICAVLAWLLALGTHSVFWFYLLRVPGFDKFRVPFKFMAMVVVFSTLGGAIVVERLVRKSSLKPRVEAAVFAGVLGMLLIHCTLARTCFYQYHSLYGPLDPTVTNYLKPHDGSSVRFLPVLPIRSTAEDYRKGLPLDLPTLNEVHSTVGLDGLVDWDPYQLRAGSLMKRMPWQSLREYGIRYVLIHRLTDEVIYGSPRPLAGIERVLTADVSIVNAVRSQGRLVFQDQSVQLFAVDGSRPLAFSQSLSLPVRFDASGASIDVRGSPEVRELVLNVLWRPGYRAYADGKPADLQQDSWGRILVHFGASARGVQVRFRPNWGTGTAIGLILMCLGFLIVAFCRPSMLRSGGRIHFGVTDCAQAQHCVPRQIASGKLTRALRPKSERC